MKPYPHHSKRVWQSLDGIWDFRFLGESATTWTPCPTTKMS